MPPNGRDNRSHISIRETSTTERFQSKPGRGPTARIPERNRAGHSQALLQKINTIRALKREADGRRRAAIGVDANQGVCIEFESDPNFDLIFESLENATQGIELLNVRKTEDKVLAAVFVPEGKLDHFERLINGYATTDTTSGKPKNKSLIESIADIKLAVVDALWTDDESILPAAGVQCWWEVWLRTKNSPNETIELFERIAGRLNLSVGQERSIFPDRIVLLARATKEQISESIELLNCVAELRLAKETADFFTSLPSVEQEQWVEQARQELIPLHEGAPSICILDTGVNRAHPLLEQFIDPEHQSAYNPTWGVHDHNGHGTEMAGISLFADLTDILSGERAIETSHRVESVKILPPQGQNPHHLYGAITRESIARAEIANPDGQKVFCMAVATPDFRDRGQPSEWSAAIDSISSGAEDESKRLIVISAGNTDPQERHHYPNNNDTEEIHDPGQSWSALTIGAYTEKTILDPVEYPGWQPLAPTGDLSPASSTSLLWDRTWPIKPDIVFEGGNQAIDPATQGADYVDSLQLLTTGHQPTQRLLTTFGDTSAATAIASRLAAKIMSSYPNYWPETIRALMVHSADWTPRMLQVGHEQGLTNREMKKFLLRRYGFGVPNQQRSLFSTSNDLALIAEDELQPYGLDQGSIKMRDMNFHEIPWPSEVLQQLGEVEIEMRVTLSYFIQPNPARRGWTKKHRYASHGLRFDVKTATETLEQFSGRINEAAAIEDRGGRSGSDSTKWDLGPDLRSLGSVHSDRWRGTAADLAEKGYIGVYPVIGWWRERRSLQQWDNSARYSLIVSIRAPEVEIDIYNEIQNLIPVAVEINV